MRRRAVQAHGRPALRSLLGAERRRHRGPRHLGLGAEGPSEDTATKLREHFGDDEYERHFPTRGPEDVSVAAGGSV